MRMGFNHPAKLSKSRLRMRPCISGRGEPEKMRIRTVKSQQLSWFLGAAKTIQHSTTISLAKTLYYHWQVETNSRKIEGKRWDLLIDVVPVFDMKLTIPPSKRSGQDLSGYVTVRSTIYLPLYSWHCTHKKPRPLVRLLASLPLTWALRWCPCEPRTSCTECEWICDKNNTRKGKKRGHSLFLCVDYFRLPLWKTDLEIAQPSI